jgi:hypothetical protein
MDWLKWVVTLLAVTGAYGFDFPWAWLMMVFAAAGSLWYLPLGTILGGTQLAILLLLGCGYFRGH